MGRWSGEETARKGTDGDGRQLVLVADEEDALGPREEDGEQRVVFVDLRSLVDDHDVVVLVGGEAANGGAGDVEGLRRSVCARLVVRSDLRVDATRVAGTAEVGEVVLEKQETHAVDSHVGVGAEEDGEGLVGRTGEGLEEGFIFSEVEEIGLFVLVKNHAARLLERVEENEQSGDEKALSAPKDALHELNSRRLRLFPHKGENRVHHPLLVLVEGELSRHLPTSGIDYVGRERSTQSCGSDGAEETGRQRQLLEASQGDQTANLHVDRANVDDRVSRGRVGGLLAQELAGPHLDHVRGRAAVPE